MANLNKIIYLSEEQKTTLFKNNSITINGKTITYNENDLYLTPLNVVTGVKGNNENQYRSGNINITKDNIGLGNVENTKLSDWAGSNKLTTIGTLANGIVPWARLSDVPSASTTTAGIIQIGTGETNAAAGNHIHTISLNKNNIDSSQITLDYGEKYKLTAGNNSITFTMPNKINAASATNNILHGTSSETEITYAPYTNQQNRLSFDTSTSAPTGIDRLNLNGYLYATKLYSGGQEVLTTVSSTTNENTTATQFVYSITQNNNGEISVTTRSLPTYNDYVLPTAANNNLGGIKTGFSTSSTSDKNYAVKVDDNGNAYVNVPWEDTHQDISGKLNKFGDTMTGALTLYGDPTDNLHAATKQYVDNAFTTNDALVFKGTLGTSGDGATVTSLPDTHKQGWTYKVITAGTYAGQNCEIGDTIYCITDGTVANNAHWTVVQTNIDGSVIGPSESANGIAVFTGTTGKAIKDSGKIITTTAPISSSADTTIPTSKAVWNAISSASGYGKEGTVTSVAASGSNGITISGSPITTSGTITVGLNLSTAINGLGEETSNATRNDYAVVQYAGGGTTTTTYHRKKLSNIFAALNSSDITTALDYTPYNATNPNNYTSNTGTVESITLKAGNGIVLDTDNTAITSSGTRTISHADTSSVENLIADGHKYITGLTFDTYGHVTGYTTGTETGYTLTGLMGSSSKGSQTKPIYWDGSTFNTITSYEGNAASATKANLERTTTGSVTYYRDEIGTFAYDQNFKWDSDNQTLTAAKLNGYVIAGQKAESNLGDNSTAEGYNTIASGRYSHAEGNNTIANHASQHVFGEYNLAETFVEDPTTEATERGNYIEIVGNGTAENSRSNARTLDWDGNETIGGNLTIANKVNLVFNTTTNALDFVFI